MQNTGIFRHPSPNHDARPLHVAIDILLLHYTGMPTGSEALKALCNPVRKVSAHYLIEEDGRIFALVEEDRRAWHAGKACWRGFRNINARAIGIELVNPGHEWGYRDFPEAQMQALIFLAREILSRHPIPPRHVLGHSDVAPRRKQDPGERLDWQVLAKAGVGLWVGPEVPVGTTETSSMGLAPGLERCGGRVLALRRDLYRFGYDIETANDRFDDDLEIVVQALQRHYCPWRVDGVADTETVHILHRLLVLAGEGHV